ncbi:hypothetical protein SAMN05444004_102312 [Jannaschia faecimaris]|uniref:DUF465 domain-containing protein n=1 Tax=Jannaschia faecimaris TaxID=1244108 RepID=A0A1H3LU37_9RHOB|nr:DUF465 domain-containing protein [Jannaschia faecimaris]SDY67840.1 hypothetical protein SAMN05444004_102312 [Jannaschia faecimaris]
MSLTSHLSELRKKHETLSQQVEAEARSPGVDSIALTEMKKRKLAIKQEIEKLSASPAH